MKCCAATLLVHYDSRKAVRTTSQQWYHCCTLDVIHNTSTTCAALPAFLLHSSSRQLAVLLYFKALATVVVNDPLTSHDLLRAGVAGHEDTGDALSTLQQLLRVAAALDA